MQLSYFKDLFPIQIPISKNGKIWNGRPDEFSNLPGSGLDYSQYFGLTPYAKTGIYGYYNGKPRPHNGHDFAGAELTSLVAPCRCWASFVAYDKTNPKGADPSGYGNYIFVETETKTVNGEKIKMEYVLAHCVKITADANRWYEQGDILAFMGSTGMSTGPHTHFAGRPLIVKSDGSIEWAVKDEATRGYVDLTDFFITKPIYDKQELLKQVMKLIKKEGDSNIYAIDPKGRACLVLNWDTYQKGLESELWEDSHDKVKQLPELGPIIVLTPNN